MATARTKGRKPKELSEGFAALKAAFVDQPKAAKVEAAKAAEEAEKLTGKKPKPPAWHTLAELPFRKLFAKVADTLATSRDLGEWSEGDRLRRLMFDGADEYAAETAARWKAAFKMDPPMSWTDWTLFCGVVGIVAPDKLTDTWITTRLVPSIFERYRATTYRADSAATAERAAPRNRWFLKRYNEGSKPAKIRNEWNDDPNLRHRIAPNWCDAIEDGQRGIDIVKKGIRWAKCDKEKREHDKES